MIITLDPASKSVPASYYGVWRRVLLENKQGRDADSLVLWMQTSSIHADIRIPASRPDFSGYTRLEECPVPDLRWIASQQGFYGMTFVQADICKWQRQHDFQPNNGLRDIAKIAFTSENEMLETGVDENYLEIWRRIQGTEVNLSYHVVNGENRYGCSVLAYVINAGNQVAYVRPRTAHIPDANSLIEAIDLYQPNHETLLDWLDFEISFGQKMDDEYWKIRHSTHPFREGMPMKTGRESD